MEVTSTAPYKIDLVELQLEMVKLANEQPDFVYTDQSKGTSSCSYVGAVQGAQGGQGCIVGQALMRLGVPEDALRTYENDESNNNTADFLLSDWTFLEHQGTGNQISTIHEVQINQDSKLPWRVAIEPVLSSLAL